MKKGGKKKYQIIVSSLQPTLTLSKFDVTITTPRGLLAFLVPSGALHVLSAPLRTRIAQFLRAPLATGYRK